MNRVLFKLYGLTVKGALRGLGRKFTTVRGAILSIVTLGFFALMFAQLLFTAVMRQHASFAISDRSQLLADILPLGMLAYFILGIAPSLGERAIHFSPSEIDFLFPAPFSRRQLLGFFLLRGLVGKLGLATLLAVSLSVLVPSLPTAIVGVFLSFVFLHGATIAAQLANQAVGTQLYSRARRIVVAIVVVAAGIGIARAMPTGADLGTWFTEFRGSATVRWITAPFEVYSRLIVAPRFFPQALPDLTIAIVMIAAVYGLVFRLDNRFEDLAVRTSQRMYSRLQAVRGGNMYAAALRRTEYTRSLVPRFPWWHGIGPNLHRQLLSGLREARGMFWLGLIIAAVASGMMVYAVRENPKLANYVGFMVLGATAYVTFILSGQMPFGIRGDLNHMEVLKSLPQSPITVAAAEVGGAVVIGCLGQWCLIAVGIVGAPSQFAILFSGAAFCIPYNFLLFGINNLLLLLFPFRLASSSPDITLMGRVMIMMMASLFAVVLGAGVASIPAVVVYLLTTSWVATLLVAWAAMMVQGIALLYGVAWSFRRFDVSTDMPD